MAAGAGTRMRSALPKVLHPLCGRPLVAWPIAAAREAGAGRVAVIASPDRDLSSALPEGVETVVQEVADGTGGALRAALPLIRESETVVVLSGDHPLITAELLGELIATHVEAGAAATLMTAVLEDPGSYGRIVRDADGDVKRVVETKEPSDATPEELEIKEVNAGTYAFAAAPLAQALEIITNDNSQGEYYLGDVLPAIRAGGGRVAAYPSPAPEVNLGVNSRVELARLGTIMGQRILERQMLAGATIVDPSSTWIDADVELAADVRIEPGCSLRGRTSVGAGSVVGPMTTLIDASLGERVNAPHSYLVDCDVLDDCQIGPFAYLRPRARLEQGAKAGAFVEIKNSVVGPGSKVPHLSYIGDADIGEDANLGAGTITANYDGFAKHRTTIGDHVRIGVDTALVAPVSVGNGAYTGAGSVVSEDVPPGALAITRSDQQNIEGYAEKKAKEAADEEEGGKGA
ncbi:MAG: bifunctional UDP-N-acetylglucosamine pyrophosphorylase / glucosamine-phosphate N-acetyltransferase [Solirubrobacterales bacterium]|jgi:bifunctional UDP-N-acetylglucosamine pyrophosphorylase/glucosamine-1-phosphate N-acetyltransferase|nr:bifunctional UDP-N-acetylglucosamine pyrophosphorylase / glucosamine-phosphate N-acetyltransferase [Solirubrobacterales bacterium]